MYGLFFALQQQRQLRQAEETAARSRVRAKAAQERTALLEDRLDKLLLACAAMWALVRQKTDLTEEDLLQKVQEIDLQDGVKDGKITRKVARCPNCKRIMSPRHRRCLYCGAEKLDLTAFDQAL